MHPVTVYLAASEASRKVVSALLVTASCILVAAFYGAIQNQNVYELTNL